LTRRCKNANVQRCRIEGVWRWSKRDGAKYSGTKVKRCLCRDGACAIKKQCCRQNVGQAVQK